MRIGEVSGREPGLVRAAEEVGVRAVRGAVAAREEAVLEVARAAEAVVGVTVHTGAPS